MHEAKNMKVTERSKGVAVEIRWFVNKDSTGKISAVYRTEWKGSSLVLEQVWGEFSTMWSQSHVVGNWFFKGDNGVEEISVDEAASRLPAEALT
jgi:hypothetical protein